MNVEIGGYIDIIHENEYAAYMVWPENKTSDAIITRSPGQLVLNSGVTWTNRSDNL